MNKQQVAYVRSKEYLQLIGREVALATECTRRAQKALQNGAYEEVRIAIEEKERVTESIRHILARVRHSRDQGELGRHDGQSRATLAETIVRVNSLGALEEQTKSLAERHMSRIETELLKVAASEQQVNSYFQRRSPSSRFLDINR